MAGTARNLTQYYRWQFLRLNENYRRDHDLFVKNVKAIKNNPKVHSAAKEEEIQGILDELFEKYRINGLYNYKKFGTGYQ
jgi:hypothetical protein